MFTLIIKGDEAAAFAACSAHKVELTSIVKHPVFDETIVTVLGNTDMETLGKWFNEHSVIPLPPGGLLWYGPVRLAPTETTPVPKGWDKIEAGTDQ